MAYCWKEEYSVRDGDGEDMNWFDGLEDALKWAIENNGYEVVKMKHYQIDYETVWERE